MAFDLMSLLGDLGGALAGQQQPDPQDSSPSNVSGVSVTARSPKLGPVSPGAANSVANAYDNRALVQGIGQVEQGYPQHHGMFGVSGTLRNVLGTIGDAFLIRDGHQPMYRPQVQAEEIGDATTGMSSDPQHAIERLRALGIPGADDLAQKYQEQLNTQQLREATLQNTQAYREGILGQRQDVLKDRQLQQSYPYIQGILNAGAATKDPAKWAAARAQAAAYASKRGIDIDKDLGIPDNMDEYVGGTGMTANQQQVSSDKAAQRQQSQTNAGIAAGSRVQAAGISAGRPTQEAIIQSILKKKMSGQATSPAEDQLWDANVNRKNQGRGGGTLHFTPNGAQPTMQPATPKFQEGNIYQDAKGNKARYVGGKFVPVQ